MSGLSDDDKIRKIRFTFHELIIGEILRVLDPMDPRGPIGVAGMILSLCAIDFLGTLFAGRDSNDATFTAFVIGYLGTYDPKKLWALRNNLVHNYVVPRNSYPIDAGRDRRVVHLQTRASGGKVIVVDSLVDDIEEAGETLLQEALSALTPTIRGNVLKRANTPGILRFLPES